MADHNQRTRIKLDRKKLICRMCNGCFLYNPNINIMYISNFTINALCPACQRRELIRLLEIQKMKREKMEEELEEAMAERERNVM